MTKGKVRKKNEKIRESTRTLLIYKGVIKMAKNKIRAHLYDNTLTTEDAHDFIARAEIMKSLTVKDICESAVDRGGADISAPAMEHAIELFNKEAAYLLSNGFAANTSLFHAAARIKGVFNSSMETFNHEKHTIDIHFNQGDLVRKEMNDVEVDVRGLASTDAHIAQVVDIKSQSINNVITPNYDLRIIGNKLKIIGDDARNGVFFVSEENPAIIIDVPSVDIINNNPSELLIRCPATLSGRYRLEIVTQYGSGGGHILKEPRISVFDRVLTTG